jgi:hypothetical protein
MLANALTLITINWWESSSNITTAWLRNRLKASRTVSWNLSRWLTTISSLSQLGKIIKIWLMGISKTLKTSKSTTSSPLLPSPTSAPNSNKSTTNPNPKTTRTLPYNNSMLISQPPSTNKTMILTPRIIPTNHPELLVEWVRHPRRWKAGGRVRVGGKGCHWCRLIVWLGDGGSCKIGPLRQLISVILFNSIKHRFLEKFSEREWDIEIWYLNL